MNLPVRLALLALALSAGACASSPAVPPRDASAVVDTPAPAADAPAADTPAVATDTPAPTADTPAPAPSFTAMPFLAEAPVRSFAEAPAMMLSPTRRYRAVMETDAGRLVLNLYSVETPITCNSFVWLARNRFFEGIAFHRVIDGFVVQGGDPGTVDGPRSTWGRGGPGYRFGLEIVDDLRFDAAGVVGMARSSDPNSNGSQFYITLAPTPSLDGQYTVFGRLADADSVAVLARVVRGQPPTEPTRITRVTIEEAPR